MAGPLDGIRVVEFSSMAAGPLAAGMLADLGATVIKVEPPGGDGARALEKEGPNGSCSPVFASCNQGKQFVCLDLKDPAGLEAARGLIASADIVIENFYGGKMAGLGLCPTTLRAERPELIWATVSGFGAHGPWRDLPGVDPVIQAESGMLSSTGDADGPGFKTGFAGVDVTTAHIVVGRILAAVLQRARTGEGDHLHQSLFETSLSLQSFNVTQVAFTGTVPPRMGNGAASGTPADVVRSADRAVFIAAFLDHQFQRFCDVMGRPDWATDERFTRGAARLRHRDELLAQIEAMTTTMTSSQIVDRLQRAGVMVATIREYDDVLRTDEVRDNGYLVPAYLPDGSMIEVMRTPYHGYRTAGPRAGSIGDIGRDNDDVLAAELR